LAIDDIALGLYPAAGYAIGIALTSVGKDNCS
jgi:hypothetical protein